MNALKSAPPNKPTYNIENDDCEIVTINSLVTSIGIGTALLESVKTVAVKNQCSRIWLTTTNDNLNALRFYQKHGFHLVEPKEKREQLLKKYWSIPERQVETSVVLGDRVWFDYALNLVNPVNPVY